MYFFIWSIERFTLSNRRHLQLFESLLGAPIGNSPPIYMGRRVEQKGICWPMLNAVWIFPTSKVACLKSHYIYYTTTVLIHISLQNTHNNQILEMFSHFLHWVISTGSKGVNCQKVEITLPKNSIMYLLKHTPNNQYESRNKSKCLTFIFILEAWCML